ncbi:hypothetical protein B0H16DRAFT_1469698 [Mycena metata]|uniref:Uncharacterized protein n=1 Tax=Mycena metata TaxID=1033252 RepID=A0AAD7MTS6_9AGAR|nr:hypothetical protein B0H16DRAFT_1469698 [Mycena metata]
MILSPAVLVPSCVPFLNRLCVGMALAFEHYVIAFLSSDSFITGVSFFSAKDTSRFCVAVRRVFGPEIDFWSNPGAFDSERSNRRGAQTTNRLMNIVAHYEPLFLNSDKYCARRTEHEVVKKNLANKGVNLLLPDLGSVTFFGGNNGR